MVRVLLGREVGGGFTAKAEIDGLQAKTAEI
jgi:hypothetical protein